MNIVNKLTARHLRKNKRRTLITIIGVIISVAMIMAVSTLGVSFLDLMKRQTIADTGEWHVQYKNITKEQLGAIAKDESTDKLVIANDRGYSPIQGSENRNKPYIFIKEFNKQGYKQFPVELSKGRLPKAANEVVISEELLKDAKLDYNLGDKLTVEIGQRILEGAEAPFGQNDPLQQLEDGTKETLQIEETNSFTIVGIMKRPVWEQTWSPGYTVINYIDSTLLTENDRFDAIVVVDKVNGSLYSKVNKIKKENDIDKVVYNEELLRYYGVTDNDSLRLTLFSLAGIIMVVIIVGSVALIYNAFAISVSERARHLGMLSSVGATKKQKRNSVFFEGFLIGLISIPIGVIAGVGGIAATFWFINKYLHGALGESGEKLAVIVTPLSLLIACLISILTIFISTYLPARKASKISAIDAIRQTQDIKLSGKTVKTSKLVRKIFGIEAEIGLKNVKRNKKRYKVTVFSLVISIVLYLSVSFFTNSISKSAELSQDGVNFDISVSSNDMSPLDLEPFTHLKNVTETSIQTRIQLSAAIPEDAFPDLLSEKIKEEDLLIEDGKYEYYVNLYGLDDSSFRTYAETVGTDLKSFTDSEQPTAIMVDKTSYQDFDSGKFIETKAILHAKPGDKIELVLKNYETMEHVALPELKIGALTDEVPMGVTPAGLGGLNIIVPQKTMDELINGNAEVKEMVEHYIYLNSSDPIATQKEIEDTTSSNVYVYNVFKQKQNEQQLIMFLSVFTFGFIALISLISIANIFNTISTSISLRKREFAMLKSVGLTPKGFNKMIYYESIFYGVKALLYGLPISGVVMFLMFWSLQNTFEYGFILPWMNILFVIVAIFIIVSSAMLYSIQKIKKENIIDGLIQDNI